MFFLDLICWFGMISSTVGACMSLLRVLKHVELVDSLLSRGWAFLVLITCPDVTRMTQPVNLVSPSQLEATGAVRPSSVCHAELHLNRGKFPWDSNKVDFSKLELMAGSCVGAQNLDSNCLDFDLGFGTSFRASRFRGLSCLDLDS